MGAKYTTLSTTGYNSSPPPDDGSQSASNLVTWAAQKTKLADPIKTLADAINTALVAALNTSVRQTSLADSTVAADNMRTVEIAPTVSNTVTVALGDAVTMTTSYLVAVRNSSTISQIISRVTAGDKIDGVAGNITIPSKSTILFTTNSVPDGYLSLSRFGPVVDTDPIVVGSADGTKKVRVEADGLTTGTTRVITMPDTDVNLSGLTGTQTANTFYAGPTSGGAALPTFRTLTGADGTALVLLGSKTVAAAASITLGTTGAGVSDIQFDWTAYDEYELHFVNLLPATDAQNLQFQISQNGGTSFISTASYTNIQFSFAGTSSSVTTNSGSTANTITTTTQSNSSTVLGYSAVLKLIKPSSTGNTKAMLTGPQVFVDSGAAFHGGNSICEYTADTNAYNGLKILYASGNIASGTLYVYGIRKA